MALRASYLTDSTSLPRTATARNSGRRRREIFNPSYRARKKFEIATGATIRRHVSRSHPDDDLTDFIQKVAVLIFSLGGSLKIIITRL